MCKNTFRRITTVLVLTFFIWYFIGVDYTSSLPESNKLVLIVVDNLELSDFKEDQKLYKLAGKSYLGLISNRQLGKASISKSKLTLGSGNRLEMDTVRLDGIKLEDGSLVYNDIESIFEINKDSAYREYIGYIGEKLNTASLNTCYIGNNDTDLPDRSSMLLAIDKSGSIDMGELDILTEDKGFPGGSKTNFNKLEELYKQFLPACSFMVINIGDLYRLDYWKSYTYPEEYSALRKELINDISNTIEEIISYEGGYTYILTSGYPSKSELHKGNRLTPILVYEPHKEGVLYSWSTRRNGLLVNTDLADFVLFKLGLTSSSKLKYIARNNSFGYISYLNNNILRISRLRQPILTNYALFEIISALIVFFYLLFFRRIKSRYYEYICRIILYSNMVAPLILLLMSLSRARSPVANNIIFFAAMFLLSLLIKLISKRNIQSFIAISALTSLIIMADVVIFKYMLKHSVLGYDPMIGARFYGIGNEFTGVFIGATILLACSVIELLGSRISMATKKACLLLYFLSGSLVIGLPFWGANFGGTIAALVGYSFTYIYLNKIRINIKTCAIVLGIFILVFSVLLIIDMRNTDSTSHLGSFFRDVSKNGVAVLLGLVYRKLTMNIKLIKYTIWTKVLFCLIAILTFMFFRPIKILGKIFVRYKVLTAAWVGITAAGITGLLVNDSGIVMTATAMIYMCYTILMICLDEIKVK